MYTGIQICKIGAFFFADFLFTCLPKYRYLVKVSRRQVSKYGLSVYRFAIYRFERRKFKIKAHG